MITEDIKFKRVTCSISISTVLDDELRRIANEMGLTKSGVINYLVRLGLREYILTEKGYKRDGNDQ